MKIEQFRWCLERGWENGNEPSTGNTQIHLVIFFTSRKVLKESPVIHQLKNYYPQAEIIGSSATAEIMGKEVTENTIVITAIQFEENSSIKTISCTLTDSAQSEALGREILQKLPQENLKHIFVLADALKVDGTALVNGFQNILEKPVSITGGLASDAQAFEETRIFHHKILPEGSALAVGFYGEALHSVCAASAGWKPYGPPRLATKSEGTMLYELDGKPALPLYKELLGPFAPELPSIGLFYPVKIWGQGIAPEEQLTRTIVGIHEETQSIQWAGGIPQGCYVQFMMTSVEQLVEGAVNSAKDLAALLDNTPPELCLLMTCTARKAVMGQRVEEELEAIEEILGSQITYAGFYTCGEMSSYAYHNKECRLYNQTMAITALWEEKEK